MSEEFVKREDFRIVTPQMFYVDAAVDDSENWYNAFNEALQNSDSVLVEGDFTVSKAIHLKGKKRLFGKGTITRTNDHSTPDPIMIGDVVYSGIEAVIVMSGSYNQIDGLIVSGLNAGEVNNERSSDIDGIVLMPKTSNCSISNCIIGSLRSGIKSHADCYMMLFDRIHIRGCKKSGFNFSSESDKTSLTFNSCWVDNSNVPWEFKSTVYTTLNSCGADFCNHESDNEEWETLTVINDLMEPESANSNVEVKHHRGIYNFEACNVVLNSCAAENCFGKSIVYINGGNSSAVINGLHGRKNKSTWEAPYNNYPNWASAPVMTGTEGATITMNASRVPEFENLYATAQSKPQAKLVGYNYSEGGNGIVDACRVVVTASQASDDAILGASDIAVERNCLLTHGLLPHVLFDKTQISSPQISSPKISSQLSVGTNYRLFEPVTLIGEGETIHISVADQPAFNRKHFIRLRGIDGKANSQNAKPFSVDIGFGSLNTVKGVTSWNDHGVTSVSDDGDKLKIVLDVPRKNPTLFIELLSERPDLIDASTITIS